MTAEAIRENEGLESVDESTAIGGRLSSWAKLKYVIRYHWPALVYAIALTACFNTFGHGAMDLYPTFLVTQKKLHVLQETYVTCILQIGGILGGITGGYLSKYSPKYVAACFALASAPWLPLWVLPSSWNLLALGAFFLQFCYGKFTLFREDITLTSIQELQLATSETYYSNCVLIPDFEQRLPASATIWEMPSRQWLQL